MCMGLGACSLHDIDIDMYMYMFPCTPYVIVHVQVTDNVHVCMFPNMYYTHTHMYPYIPDILTTTSLCMWWCLYVCMFYVCLCLCTSGDRGYGGVYAHYRRTLCTVQVFHGADRWGQEGEGIPGGTHT